MKTICDSGTPRFLQASSSFVFLLPLAVLETYFLAQARGGPAGRLAGAALVALAALATVGGTVLAALGMWLPRL